MEPPAETGSGKVSHLLQPAGGEEEIKQNRCRITHEGNKIKVMIFCFNSFILSCFTQLLLLILLL